MDFKAKLAFFQNAVQQQNSTCGNKYSAKGFQNTQQPRKNINSKPQNSTSSTSKCSTETKKENSNLRTRFEANSAFFNNQSNQENSSTKPKQELQKKNQSTGSKFAEKLAFFKNQEENQNNQTEPPRIKEIHKNSQQTSNFAGKIKMYNNMKIPLGQPAEVKKKNHQEYQADENLQQQMVFPAELLARQRNNVEDDNDDEYNAMPARRQVRRPIRRRPTNLPEI